MTTATDATLDSATWAETDHHQVVAGRHLAEAGPQAGEDHLDEDGHQVATDLQFAAGRRSAVVESTTCFWLSVAVVIGVT